jgi:hypothetical protein
MNRKFLSASFASMFALTCIMVGPASAHGGGGGGGHGGGGHGGAMMGATGVGGAMMHATGVGGAMMGATGVGGAVAPYNPFSTLGCKTGTEHSSRCRGVRY